MLRAHNGRINVLTGSAISSFLLSEDMTLSTTAISRIKTTIGDKLKGDRDCENDFDMYRAELECTNPRAAEYLDGIGRVNWVKYAYLDHYHIPTYSEATSNLSEQANNWIGTDCRSAKPLDALIFSC
ncbi:hypothetical protein PHMEG_00025730 [Phytophthora megakarya]|uniref:Uncharacterized protein n=1 Tax=Phytophthora megakarya TaxID=4795 RepID=A0A225VCS7_9STRA|nr:hypothetical protein PHMEG_00025730 [Phytophthora megakarya]